MSSSFQYAYQWRDIRGGKKAHLAWIAPIMAIDSGFDTRCGYRYSLSELSRAKRPRLAKCKFCRQQEKKQ